MIFFNSPDVVGNFLAFRN